MCVMLGCLILCIHTYFVMSRLDNIAEQELDDIDKVALTQRRTYRPIIDFKRLEYNCTLMM